MPSAYAKWGIAGAQSAEQSGIKEVKRPFDPDFMTLDKIKDLGVFERRIPTPPFQGSDPCSLKKR